jgi:hypothetical protein
MQSLEFQLRAMTQDIHEYCVGHNLTSIDLLGHSMGVKRPCFFATKYPGFINKSLPILDQFYPQHQTILAD